MLKLSVTPIRSGQQSVDDMIERFPLPRGDIEYWLDLRRQDVTASDVPIVCDRQLYGTKARLFAEKKGRVPPQMDSSVLRRGRWDEPAVFEALSETYREWQAVRSKIYLRDTDRRLGATPDGFATAPDREGIGLVQAKTVGLSTFRQTWMLDPDDDPRYADANLPEAYRLQTLTEMMLANVNWGVVAVIIQAEFYREFRLFEIARNGVDEQWICDCVARFWHEHLDPEIMPEFDPQRDDILVKQLYPQESGSVVDLHGDNRAVQLVEDLTEKRKGATRLKREIEEIETELKGKIGDNSYATLADGHCLQLRNRARKAHFVKESSWRELRILPRLPELENQE